MVQAIEQFLSINYKGVIIALVVLVVVLVGGKELFSKFCTMFGIEFRWKREKQEELNRIKDIEKRLDILEKDKADKDNFKSDVNNTLTIVSSTLESMNAKIDIMSDNIHKQGKTTLEMTADRLIQRMRYYTQIGYIPEDELGSFNEQYQSWINLGGTNHEIEPKYNYIINNLPIKKTAGFYVIDGK